MDLAARIVSNRVFVCVGVTMALLVTGPARAYTQQVLSVGAQKVPSKSPGKPPVPATAPTQPPASGCDPSMADLKTWAVAARKANPANTDLFLKALDTAVDAPKMGIKHDGTIVLHYSPELMILLLPRYTLFRTALEETIRKMDPIEDVSTPDAVEILVAPQQMDSPDIAKIVVMRDGVLVPPLRSTLKPTAFHNRMGATATVNAGEVFYACSSFAAGAVVTVTAIPESGTNIVNTIDPKDLAAFK